MSLFKELQRRNVIRVAVAYIVAAWVLSQALDLAASAFEAPAWVLKMFMVVLALGFVPTLIFSWVYELTPEGIKREREISADQSAAAHTAKRLDVAVIVLLVAAIALPFLRPGDGGGSGQNGGQTPISPEAGNRSLTPVDSAIAVLPFADLSPGGDQAYFADGISEEILNLLAQHADLKVIARTSAFQFREAVDLREVGLALNADRILEGSVRTAGSRVRITAQLINAETGLHIWSETYDRELTDIFAVQDEIAAAITEALGVHLGVGNARAPAQQELDVDAYRLYLQGRQALAERQVPGRLLEAAELLQRSVDADPTLAAAYSAQALAWSLLPSYEANISNEDAIERSLAAADAALALDQQNAEALLAKGFVLALFQLRVDDGEALIQQALALRPNDVWTNNLAGDLYRNIGDRERALHYDGIAAQLDPLDAVQQSDLAWTQIFDRDYAASLTSARRALALAPHGTFNIDAEVWSLIGLGRLDEAERRIAVTEAAGDYPLDFSAMARLLIAVARGDEAETARLYPIAAAGFAGQHAAPTQRAVAAYTIGDLAACREAMLDAIASGDTTWLNTMWAARVQSELAAAGYAIEFPPAYAQVLARLARSPWHQHSLRAEILAHRSASR